MLLSKISQNSQENTYARVSFRPQATLFIVVVWECREIHCSSVEISSDLLSISISEIRNVRELL